MTIEVSRHGTAAENVRQLVYPVDRDRKEELLAHLIVEGDWHQVLVFTRTKLAASRLASWLDRHGVAATAIHSDRAQSDRTKALEGFKAGEIRVLVATDVAARGLDIEDLPHVVNFELPWNPEDYVHRIGRTGRAGASGDAVSLVCIDEADLLRGVQRLLRHAIPWTVEEGFVPRRDAEAQPLRAPRGAGGSGAPRPERPGRPLEPTAFGRRLSVAAGAGAGSARRQDDLEQRRRDPRRVVAALVREHGDRDALRRQVAHDVAEPEVAAGVAERRTAGEGDALDAEPVRDPGLEGAGPGHVADHLGLDRRREQRPPAKACIQRAVSRAVAAIDPAPPAAVTTERKGMTSLRGATGTARTRPRREQPEPGGLGRPRLLDPLVPGRVEAERIEEPVADLVRERVPGDRLTSSPSSR